MEVLVDKVFMKGIEYDKINSLDLRSDIENNNIFACVLRAEGYVGNRPADCEDEFHEDDTWAIDCLTEDGMVVGSYLYSSEFEYDEDIKLLKEFE
jgi:hypothetical protein